MFEGRQGCIKLGLTSATRPLEPIGAMRFLSSSSVFQRFFVRGRGGERGRARLRKVAARPVITGQIQSLDAAQKEKGATHSLVRIGRSSTPPATPERGHSCPQPVPNFQPPRFIETVGGQGIAADRNVSAPAVVPRCTRSRSGTRLALKSFWRD